MHGPENLEFLLSIVCSVYEAHSAVLFLPGQEEEEYVLAGKFSLGDKIIEDVIIRPGMGMVGWVLKNRQPMKLNTFDRNKSRLGYYDPKDEAQIKAFLGCPLPRGRGALCLDSKRTHSFSEKDQKLLQLFATLIQDWYEHYQEAHDGLCQGQYFNSLQQLMRLHQVEKRWLPFLEQFLNLLAEGSGFEHAFLAVRDSTGKAYSLEWATLPLLREDPKTLFPMGSGLVGWVFKNGQALHSGETAKAPISSLFGKSKSHPSIKRVICEPITVQRTTRAVLGIAKEGEVPLTAELKNFVNISAVHLALFLENLYLKGKAHELEKELEQTREVMIQMNKNPI